MAEYDFQSLKSGKKPEEETRESQSREKESSKTNKVPKDTYNVTKKKTNVIDEICDTIFDCSLEEAFETVKTQRVFPDLKTLAYNSLVDGLGMLLGGGAPRRGGSRRSTLDEGRTDYARQSVSSNRSGSVSNDRAGNSSYNRRFDSRDYAFSSRGDAEKARYDICKICAEDGHFSVAQFLQTVKQPNDWNDWDIGWLDLSDENTMTRMVSGGDWVIILPKPVRIKS